jgi:hypothetical protein
MSDDVVPKKRTWRTWLLRAALLLVVLTATAALSIWWRMNSDLSEGRAALAAIVAELDAADPGWRWEEIEASKRTMPEEKNSALAVKRIIDSLGGWKVGDRKRADGRPLFLPEAALNRRLDEEALNLVREELAGHERVVALAVALKDHAHGNTPVRLDDDPFRTLVPHLQHPRSVAYVLQLDVERLLHSGRLADTLDRVRAMLRAGASLRDDSLLIGTLVRIAVREIAVSNVKRMLAMGTPSDDACRQLAADLEAERKEDLLRPGLRGERAMLHHLFQNLTSGRLSLERFLAGGSDALGPLERLDYWAYRYRLPEDHAAMLRRMTDMCDIARLPPESQRQAWEEFEKESTAFDRAGLKEKRRILTRAFIPAVRTVRGAILRDRASLSCAVAALAAERYRLTHKRWPDALADLVPAYLSAEPIDPFTGEPLRFVKHDAGIVLYSVGEDDADDDGDVDPPATGRPPDIGFRLFDPAQRSLPAVAK